MIDKISGLEDIAAKKEEVEEGLLDLGIFNFRRSSSLFEGCERLCRTTCT